MGIAQIRRYLTLKIGARIIIIYNGARNKREKYVGIVLHTYNNVFTIKGDNGSVKSFCYTDILTKTIQIYI